MPPVPPVRFALTMMLCGAVTLMLAAPVAVTPTLNVFVSTPLLASPSDSE